MRSGEQNELLPGSTKYLVIHTSWYYTLGMDDILTQLRKGSLELAVLALLAIEPRYGADIVDDLASRPGLESPGGTIYPLLTRLKTAGLVSTQWRESPVGPPRKYYSLTASGSQQLAAQRAAWVKLSTAIALLLKEIDR